MPERASPEAGTEPCRCSTPVGLLLALGIVLPLVVLLLVRARAKTVRRGLDLVEPPRRAFVVTVVAFVATGALVGIAAAQPVVEQTRTLRERTDAEAFVVIDVSRSMLAQSRHGLAAPARACEDVREEDSRVASRDPVRSRRR